MSGQWWAGVEPVTVEVSCGQDRHRISWRRGKLVLEDHDLAAEEAFAALGGDASLCLEVLRGWRKAVDDREVLWYWDAPPVAHDMGRILAEVRERHQQTLSAIASHLAARPGVPVATRPTGPGAPGPQGGPPGRGVVNVRRRITAPGGQAVSTGVPPDVLDQIRAQHADERRRALLSALPDEMRIRLGLAAVVRALRQQAYRPWFGPREEDLRAALASRVVPAAEACIRAWRGRLDGRHPLTVECWAASADETPSVYGLVDDSGGWAAVSVPLSWLVQVWARGVALVDGCLVLDVLDSWDLSGPLTVSATRWERRLPGGSTPVVEPALLLRMVDGGWRLRWDG